MTRATFARDVALGRDLGLSYADGDRVVTIPRYPMGNGVLKVYWSVTWRTALGVMNASGVSDTRAKAVVRIADTVKGTI